MNVDPKLSPCHSEDKKFKIRLCIRYKNSGFSLYLYINKLGYNF